MGEKDYQSLHIIYRKCIEICNKYKLPFNFKVDSGDYETAVEIIIPDSFIEKTIIYHPPHSKNWDTHPNIFCPDLLDFNYNKLIEYEEEGGTKRSGAKLAQKGHAREGDMDTKRDRRRTEYYDKVNFDVLRFYETDLKEENWQKLYDFLQK